MSDSDQAGSANDSTVEAVEAEIAILADKLKSAKQRLTQIESRAPLVPKAICPDLFQSSQHTLLLLSDSALPLGSFAYSSGLESYLAHQKPLPLRHSPLSSFHNFLHLSVESVAFSNVPYLLATFRHPSRLSELDNDIDASTLCTVARRASTAQGRALLAVWEKGLRHSTSSTQLQVSEASESLASFSKELKSSVLSAKDSSDVHGHFAPLWGAVSLALELEIHQASYLFLFNHAKAVLSAAVRAGVMGPYQAQSILAGKELQAAIRTWLGQVWNVAPEDAGQVVPSIDLWIGRHELLYSRIFNS